MEANKTVRTTAKIIT